MSSVSSARGFESTRDTQNSARASDFLSSVKAKTASSSADVATVRANLDPALERLEARAVELKQKVSQSNQELYKMIDSLDKDIKDLRKNIHSMRFEKISTKLDALMRKGISINNYIEKSTKYIESEMCNINLQYGKAFNYDLNPNLARYKTPTSAEDNRKVISEIKDSYAKTQREFSEIENSLNIINNMTVKDYHDFYQEIIPQSNTAKRDVIEDHTRRRYNRDKNKIDGALQNVEAHLQADKIFFPK